MRIFRNDGRELAPEADSESAAEREAEGRVRDVPGTDAKPNPAGTALDLPDVPRVDHVTTGSERAVNSKPYLAIPQSAPAPRQEPAGPLLTWGDFKRAVDALYQDDEVLAFIDWDNYHQVKVTRLSSGGLVIKNGDQG